MFVLVISNAATILVEPVLKLIFVVTVTVSGLVNVFVNVNVNAMKSETAILSYVHVIVKC